MKKLSFVLKDKMEGISYESTNPFVLVKYIVLVEIVSVKDYVPGVDYYELPYHKEMRTYFTRYNVSIAIR